MLARANRLRSASEFRRTLGRGKRLSGQFLVTSFLTTSTSEPTRLGFVVPKKVGNAVTRNLVKRRLRAASRQLLDQGISGLDIVVRATPASAEASWEMLRSELSAQVKAGAAR